MKILIIRFSSIGDIVLTSPVIRCIKNQVANSEIHYLTKNSFKEILTANPYISKIYPIEKEVNEVSDLLVKEHYDLIIDLHDNLRSRQVSAMLKTKTYRYSKQRFKRFSVPPKIEIIRLLKAAAICIIPVSPVITNFAFLIIDAD